MIITRSWLQEWIDIKDIADDVLAKTLNSIGLEVDRVEKYSVPQKVVFGKVLECEKHPDADKLSVCQVDIGTSVRQIVCGAKNVKKGLDVVVATVGAELPNGMKIKHAVLRGVDSEGMICSAGEIGLPDFMDGIIELDSSIGEYKIGEEVANHPIFSDTLIEIELTANRGDCLSIYGVARDLSAAFNKPLKQNNSFEFSDKKLGIGRIFALEHSNQLDVSMLYKAIDLKEATLPMLIRLRLAQIEESVTTPLAATLHYVIHSTGVILRGYDYRFFQEENQQKAKGQLKEEENGYTAFYAKEKLASIVGVSQTQESMPKEDAQTILLEASYIPPEKISRLMMEHKLESDFVYYRSSRGSEPNLRLGMDYLLWILQTFMGIEIYGGDIELSQNAEEAIISIKKEEIDSFIGADIDKTKITNILKNLGFGVQKSKSDTFVLEIPRYRHDIKNKQDIVEEIVRLVGIDNIPSKPLNFHEANRLSDDYFYYKKKQFYRQKSAANGFYEALHFAFDAKEELEAYNFEVVQEELALLNPIVNTLDTLRPTLLNWLIKSASKNKKNGYTRINLFELGSVFDTQRNESMRLSFLWSGAIERDTLRNHGKPSSVDFEFFVQKIADVIGSFELQPYQTKHTLSHKYQCGAIYQDGKFVGEVFRLHPLIEKEFDLDTTYLCELNFEALPYSLKTAQKISKYQASFRDLSLLVAKELPYNALSDAIESLEIAELKRFYPVDKFEDEKLGDNLSLTLRFVLQSDEKTLEEEDITSAMDKILEQLKEKFGVELR